MNDLKRLLKPEVYICRVEELQAQEEFVINSVSTRMLALYTTGDGSCAIHAFFGELVLSDCGYFELYKTDPRDLAARLLGTSWEDLEHRIGAEAQGAMRDIKAQLWGYICKYFEEPNNECEIFWRCLYVQNPELAEEAREIIQNKQVFHAEFETAKAKTLQASKLLFSRETEPIIRHLAVHMGCIPSNVDVLQLSEGERVALLLERDDVDFLREAFDEDVDGFRYIRGLYGEAFPHDGPTCRYEALFDERPEFDSLRLALLVHGDVNSGINTFLMRLQSLMEGDTEGVFAAYIADVHTFLETARCWSNLQCPATEIPNFTSLAWCAYIECVKNPDYYFSIPELLVLAAVSKRNVSVFTSFNLNLRYEGGYYGGDGPVVNIKLDRNDEQEAERTHYERIIPAELAEELLKNCRQEKEAKRRRLEEPTKAKREEDDKACSGTFTPNHDHTVGASCTTLNELVDSVIGASNGYTPIDSQNEAEIINQSESGRQEATEFSHLNDLISTLMDSNETVRFRKRDASNQKPQGLKFCEAFSSAKNGVFPRGEEESSEESSNESSSSEGEDNELEEQYFSVRADDAFCKQEPVEQDIIKNRCQEIRKLLRSRPTLPLKADGSSLSSKDLATGVRLPLYSCPFSGCNDHFNNRTRFLHHVAGGVSDSTHREALERICRDDYTFLTPLDYVSRAVGEAERERWPLLGLSTTRRSLNLLCLRYNDDRIKCVSCFICGQLRTTCEGYPYVDLKAPAEKIGYSRKEIAYSSLEDLVAIELSHPGTLLNNCSYELWQRRYRQRSLQKSKHDPWELTEPLEQPMSSCTKTADRHISRWAIRCPLLGKACMLFGCTEDITCQSPDIHKDEYEEAPYVRTLCPAPRHSFPWALPLNRPSLYAVDARDNRNVLLDLGSVCGIVVRSFDKAIHKLPDKSADWCLEPLWFAVAFPTSDLCLIFPVV